MFAEMSLIACCIHRVSSASVLCMAGTLCLALVLHGRSSTLEEMLGGKIEGVQSVQWGSCSVIYWVLLQTLRLRKVP